MLIKILIISFIVIYVIARFAGFFFRIIGFFTGRPLNVNKSPEGPIKGATAYRSGDMTIYQQPTNKHRKPSDALGDYVDYEEVKEDQDKSH